MTTKKIIIWGLIMALVYGGSLLAAIKFDYKKVPPNPEKVISQKVDSLTEDNSILKAKVSEYEQVINEMKKHGALLVTSEKNVKLVVDTDGETLEKKESNPIRAYYFLDDKGKVVKLSINYKYNEHSGNSTGSH